MPLSDLSPTAQDYLKHIWTAAEYASLPVTVGGLAKRLGVSASTASEAVRKLTDAGLVTHARYGSVELTAAGRGHALLLVRRHRLLETFLVEVLGYGWDEVHDEAEVLEHAVSDTLITRIDGFLGHPARDPHGDPIPSAELRTTAANVLTLLNAEPGQQVRVVRVSDEDPALLRYCADLGLRPGAELTVMERPAFGVGVRLRMAGNAENLDVGDVAAAAISVEELGS
ncbi:metal-dependent transcriptional regulator [Arthrobacter sp. UNC362MFTsu5.1]|uniref:metal-dependent transcriptional regulator n=1 Tax=Arthrobacter sp. UNC362MFTsu5.1 TaxID=1449044 RepID=UPI000480409E|nr:metal-dependent transcriptional regulator [Arthrobacter sp. UNC362MFTsu5.1]